MDPVSWRKEEEDVVTEFMCVGWEWRIVEEKNGKYRWDDRPNCKGSLSRHWSCQEKEERLGMVAHAFNPSTWEAEAREFLSSRPAWSTEWVPGQPGLYRDTLLRERARERERERVREREWERESTNTGNGYEFIKTDIKQMDFKVLILLLDFALGCG